MSIEDLAWLTWLEQWLNWQEVSKEKEKKVQEDWKKSQQVKRQIQAYQCKWAKLAKILTKILQRYFDDWKIIHWISSFLDRISKTWEELFKIFDTIFSPFIDWNIPNEISDYIHYIQNLKSKIWQFSNDEAEMVFRLIEKEQVWWKTFWELLKSGKWGIDYNSFKLEIKKELTK